LIVDAPGLTVSKKGNYIEEKWIRKRKEFIKVHTAADTKSKKAVSFRVTRGNVHDAKKFCPLVIEAARIKGTCMPNRPVKFFFTFNVMSSLLDVTPSKQKNSLP
jgi:Transposase DDE domain